LIENQFYIGKGDRTTFFEVVLNSDPTKIKFLAQKLLLVTNNTEFEGKKIYNDKLCNNLNLNQQLVYKLWLHCVRRHKTITLDEMIKFAPYMEERILLWDKYVDEEGRTTRNMQEYMAYRKQKAEEANRNQKKKKAAKGKKGKL
jgi:hypothetical protein